MKVELAQNIRKLRKEKKMTQENLAEALGVSVAVISKWELGASTPDVQYIADIASFFETSVDVLFGYDLQSDNLNKTLEALDQCRQSKDYDQALLLIEKAIQKYANNFMINYKSGRLLALFGIEKNNVQLTERAIQLHYRAIDLISQNVDESISEIEIYSEIAESLITTDRAKDALQILKKHNPGGLNNATIAMIYASELKQADEAFPYLTKALGENLQVLIRTIIGFVNAYTLKKEYLNAYEAIEWLIQNLKTYKKQESDVTYIDKLVAVFNVGAADLCIHLNQKDQALQHLLTAYQIAQRFDEHPDYGIKQLRFCESASTLAVAYDDLGETAIKAIKQMIKSSEQNQNSLEMMWKEIDHDDN